jgi:hypothetical protein
MFVPPDPVGPITRENTELDAAPKFNGVQLVPLFVESHTPAFSHPENRYISPDPVFEKAIDVISSPVELSISVQFVPLFVERKIPL